MILYTLSQSGDPPANIVPFSLGVRISRYDNTLKVLQGAVQIYRIIYYQMNYCGHRLRAYFFLYCLKLMVIQRKCISYKILPI